MIDLTGDIYKNCSGIIDRKLKKGYNYEQIKTFNTSDKEQQKYNFAEFCDNVGLYDITFEDWCEIVDHVKLDKESEVDISIITPTMIPNSAGYDYKLNNEMGSAWRTYKGRLLNKGMSIETVNSIEESAHRTLNKLSLDTSNRVATKGLIVGNVQSGKTSNMAALMAMAADLGFNMFIVLSGSIENLRIQTQERLIKDLNCASNVSWIPVNNVNTKSTYEFALAKLDLKETAINRYLMVCLKNSTRLNNVLKWINKDKNKTNLKILIIDDEADQAGINSKTKIIKSKNNPDDIERTKINNSIVDLLNDRDERHNNTEYHARAINYVAYTATPYANILNEKPGKNSIYPSDFVGSLGVSNEYFGPQQIFGLETENFDGMNIVNRVEEKELQVLNDTYGLTNLNLPKSLKEAVLWYYCCLATMRVKKSTKPFSMLIHTSQKQNDHDNIANVLKQWLQSYDSLDFLNECKAVYQKQTSKFTLENFWSSYPTYGNKNVDDYLDFNLISNEIVSIFNSGIRSILIDEKDEPNFSKGVHLCIDNCSHNYIENSNEHIRLLYPTKEMDYATGFIVIGGATLSRGLTIEGLVSTYFVRTVKQADSLMQMGRWFGYRKGYELLPRIWMSEDTKDKFEFLSAMDYELRKRMKDMQDQNISPQNCGIKILNYFNKQLQITSKNKMKDANIVEKSFDGLTTQTTMFFEDEKILKDNYDLTVKFVDSLPNNPVKLEKALLWHEIESRKIIDYMKEMRFPNNDSKSLDVKLFDKWYTKLKENYGYNHWNVAISGSQSSKDAPFSKYNIKLVNRSKKSGSNDGIIRIGALRSPQDLYIDIDENNPNFDENDVEYIKAKSTSMYQAIRTKAGLNHTPLLVLYIIDKESKPLKGGANRVELDTKTDVIGFMVLIPENEKESMDEYIGIDLSVNNDEYEESGVN